MRLSGIRRSYEVLERPHLGRKAFEIETQSERSVDALVDALVFDQLIGLHEPAPRIFERSEERRALEDVPLHAIVGFAEDLHRRAFHR